MLRIAAAVKRICDRQAPQNALEPGPGFFVGGDFLSFVIGRKNWLFSGSPRGARASAAIYTLVETAKANHIKPLNYLEYILKDMPRSAFLEHPEYLDDYLPWSPIIREQCS